MLQKQQAAAAGGAASGGQAPIPIVAQLDPNRIMPVNVSRDHIQTWLRLLIWCN